jgi:hypothetical protein
MDAQTADTKAMEPPTAAEGFDIDIDIDNQGH